MIIIFILIIVVAIIAIVTLSKVSTSQGKSNNMCVKRQPLFANPFSFYGRISRLEYGLSSIVNLFYNLIISILVIADSSFYIFYLPAFIFIFAQSCKRFHDMNQSGFRSLLLLIPFINLVFFFILLCWDGDSYENDYGEDPKGRNTL